METDKTNKKSGNLSQIQPEDKRIRRTKKLLKNALKELILEQGFEEIRVQDVIDRADVGRTSFYTYFKNKEDLLLQNLEDLEDLFKPSKNNKSEENDINYELEKFSLNMFRHLQENWKLAKALMGNKRILIVRNQVQNIILNYYKKQYQKKWGQTRSAVEIEAAAVCTAGALVSMTLWWLTMNKPVSPEKMHKMFLNSIN